MVLTAQFLSSQNQVVDIAIESKFYMALNYIIYPYVCVWSTALFFINKLFNVGSNLLIYQHNLSFYIQMLKKCPLQDILTTENS